MTERLSMQRVEVGVAGVSPRSGARIVGVVYLSFFLAAILGELVMQQAGFSNFSVPGDAAATAHRLLAHEATYRLGFALGLVSTLCYVAVTALFYQLFRPVNRSIALVAAFLGLTGCAVTAFGSLFQLAPFVVLGSGPSLPGFDVAQLQALALIFLDLNARIGSIALVFFGVFQVLVGYLIIRSTFLPRIFGALIALAGLGWLTVLAPPLASQLQTELMVLGVLGELPLMLWLLVMGMDGRRWIEQAGAAEAPASAGLP
jgi:uncharacterized protein DUF4386